MTKRVIEFVEHEAHGFGFGKPVARTEVTGMTEAEVAAEIEAMFAIVGHHCVAVEIEFVPAVAA